MNKSARNKIKVALWKLPAGLPKFTKFGTRINHEKRARKIYAKHGIEGVEKYVDNFKAEVSNG